jgi:hypothetical protein
MPAVAPGHKPTVKETIMYNQFEDQVFLAPESTVSLHFETDQDWDIATGEALERAERSAWARHALRANGFGGAGADDESDEDRSRELREAMRHVLALSMD